MEKPDEARVRERREAIGWAAGLSTMQRGEKPRQGIQNIDRALIFFLRPSPLSFSFSSVAGLMWPEKSGHGILSEGEPTSEEETIQY